MKKGIFIAFEGLDGSGKTTQFNAIRGKLAEHQIKCKEEKEPSDRNLVGLLLQGIVKKLQGLSVSPVSLAKLFSVDRYEHILHDIKPYIDSGGNVIMDRFIFSSFAYQGLDLSYDEIYFYNRESIQLLMPDVTIFIDTPPEICIERIIAARVGKELFDDKLKAVRENYLEAFKRMRDTANVIIVNGNQPPEAVTEEIWRAVSPLFIN